MARRTLALVLVLLLAGSVLAVGLPAIGVAAESPKKAGKEDYYELYKILVDTMDQVERNYVKEIDRRELVEAAIKGVLSKLDPYSSYIGPDDFNRFRSTVENQFGGIGIQITIEEGQLKVLSPLAGTPAYRAGLLAGDRVVEINGKPTAGITLDEAVQRLKGEEGTQVTLSVIHPGSTNKEEVTITREVIHVETVLGDRHKPDDTWDFMLDPEKHIGYIRVTAFGRDTARDLRKALDALQKQQLKGLILDLRFNPGGLLTSGIEVSDLFISKGRIVSTKGRNSPERSWDAQKSGTYEGFPMVVLVNRYSASAAEIVSACLQDHKRAVVMGERTWGKGSVQNVIELEDRRSALKLTTAGYLRPSGKNIHRFPDAKQSDEWGVMPDQGFELKLPERELVDLVHYRRQRDILLPHQPQHASAAGADEGPDEADEGPDEKVEPDQKKAKPDKEAKRTDDPPAVATPQDDGAKPKPAKPDSAKPEEAEPKPAGSPPRPANGPADGPVKPKGAGGKKDSQPEEPEFVDRQLQMAIDYLTGELARAG